MKRTITWKRPIVFLLIFLIIAPFGLNLAGCENEDVFGEMLSRTRLLYGEGFSDSFKIPFNIGLPSIAADALTYNTGKRFSEEREIVLYGESHKAISGYEGAICEYYNEPINKALCRDESGTLYSIKYTQNGKDLCEFEDLNLKKKTILSYEDVDTSKAQNVAERYVAETLNGKYGKNILIKQYKLEKQKQLYGGELYEFEWNYFERGVVVHSVRVRVNGNFEVCGFTAYPMANEETRNRLFDIAEDGYGSFAEYIIGKASNNAQNGEKYIYLEKGENAELIYLHAYESYFVRSKAAAGVRSGDVSLVKSFYMFTAIGGEFELCTLPKQEYVVADELNESTYDFDIYINGGYSYELEGTKITDCYGTQVDCSYSTSNYIEDIGRYCDIYRSNRGATTLIYDRKLERITSFNFDESSIECDSAEVMRSEAEAIVGGFMNENFQEINFDDFTLTEYRQNGEKSYFVYKLYINGFEADTVSFRLKSKTIYEFDLKVFTDNIEIPEYDDETLLFTALKKQGETEKIAEPKVLRGHLTTDEMGVYRITYSVYYKAFDNNGRLGTEKDIFVNLPIAAIENEETNFEFLISHNYDDSEQDIFTEHNIPNEIEAPISSSLPEYAIDSYKPNLYEQGIPQFIELEVDGELSRFELGDYYSRIHNWKQTNICTYVYKKATTTHGVAYTYTTEFDAKTMDLLSFHFYSASETLWHKHANGKEKLSEEQAIEVATSFLKKYKNKFDPSDYTVSAHVQDEGDCIPYYIYFQRYHNGIETESINVTVYECGAIGYIQIHNSPYTSRVPENITFNFMQAATERILTYLDNIKQIKRVKFNFSIPQYVYIEEKNAYAVAVTLNVALYNNTNTDASLTAYVPLTLYHIYDYNKAEEAEQT